MGYPIEQNPINYLKRRVVYYKKKRGLLGNSFVKTPTRYMIQMCGGRAGVKKVSKMAIENINKRITDFEAAIKILESAEKRKKLIITGEYN